MDPKQPQSTIVTKDVEPIQKDQFKLPTWGALTLLIVAFIVLKSLIYIKDKKRHGK